VLRGLVAPQWDYKPAVDDVSFDVGQGELLALLGPNGAGKSTIIKMLTGIIAARRTPCSSDYRAVPAAAPGNQRARYQKPRRLTATTVAAPHQ
jgi:ABC-2 type transport system ATP-binding protein